jgi:hypothetical protein
MRIMTEEPPRLEVVAPWVPPAIARIVNAALAHDRDHRIPDCESFAELLEQAIPAAFRRSDAPAPRTDDEVTVVVPMPKSNPSIDPGLSLLRGLEMAPTTPLPEQFSPYVSPAPGSGPPSHMRVVQREVKEETVVIDPRASTPTPIPMRRRSRGATNLLLLLMAVSVTAAVAVTGHVHKIRPGPRTYAVAPASR